MAVSYMKLWHLLLDRGLKKVDLERMSGISHYTTKRMTKTIRCAGEDRPTEVVKSRFMKLGYEHIQYVLDCIHENTTDIRNIKAYMLTTLYNAPMTIDHYYQTKVNHDLYGWKE